MKNLGHMPLGSSLVLDSFNVSFWLLSELTTLYIGAAPSYTSRRCFRCSFTNISSTLVTTNENFEK